MYSKLTVPQDLVDERKFLQRGPYDAADELEDRLHQSYTRLHSQLRPPYHLHVHSATDLQHLNEALVYGILTKPQVQQSLITHLAAVTRDGYVSFVSILVRLVNKCYLKLLDQTRTQLLWLVRQLIALSADEVETLCLGLLQRIAGGDLSRWNVWLAGQMLDVFRSNWAWLVANAKLLTHALFTFLRLLPDHFMAKNPALNELKQAEAAFCVKILRGHFQDCLTIGRDLVRLLQNVALIPQFESVWKDLLSNPLAFNAVGFEDIAQLYVKHTSTRYLASSLTPEMATQIEFMLTSVRMGNQRRYQAWFMQRFLSAPGSETLIPDLIRYICCVHHPPNEVLNSDIVPRWAVVGWLLNCCKSLHGEANAKLALFYDWFFFISKSDNIMNVEPAILLMVNSIPQYTDITHSLLEFLFLCMEHYDTQRKDLIFRGVRASVDILVAKGVVSSLMPLSSSPHVVQWLRDKLVGCFPKYCQRSHEGSKKLTSKETLSAAGPFSGGPAERPVSEKIEASNQVLEAKPADKEAKKVVFHQDTSSAGALTGGRVDNAEAGKINAPAEIDSVKRICDADGISIENREAEVCSALVGQLAQESRDKCMDNPPQKKQCINILTPDDLAKALKVSDKEAVSMLEKLVASNLSDFEENNGITRQYPTKDGRSFSQIVVHGAGPFETLAERISSVLNEAGYTLFAPLRRHSPGNLENDEKMSVTSAIFQMYILSCHPKLLQMLMFWHTAGFAVGARFLCYVCRLAEDPITPYSMEMDSKAAITVQVPAGHEQGEMLKSAGLPWHQKVQDIRRGKIEPQAHRKPSVSSAFEAYVEFLKGVNKKSGLLQESDNLVNGLREKAISEQELNVEVESQLLHDLETCLTWSIRKLLWVFPLVFRYLPNFSRGREQIMKLLVAVIDSRELSRLELMLSLKELSVFGSQPTQLTRILKSSLEWDCFEQQYLWRLLVAELQNPAPSFFANLVKSCTEFLEPTQHSDAASGLFLLLRMQCPTPNLISTLLFLPQSFGRLISAVLASWLSSDLSRVLGCFTLLTLDLGVLRQELIKGTEKHSCLTKNCSCSALLIFSNVLDNLIRAFDLDVDEKRKLDIVQLKRLVQDFQNILSTRTADE